MKKIAFVFSYNDEEIAKQIKEPLGLKLDQANIGFESLCDCSGSIDHSINCILYLHSESSQIDSIESALMVFNGHNIPIIPIVLNGATFQKNLHFLNTKNFLPVSYVISSKEIDRLYQSIESTLETFEKNAYLVAEGDKYLEGEIVSKDLNKALNYYVEAAERNCACAQWQIGNYYLDGYLGTKDIRKALEWYEKAADQGYYPAYYGILRIYALTDFEVDKSEVLDIVTKIKDNPWTKDRFLKKRMESNVIIDCLCILMKKELLSIEELVQLFSEEPFAKNPTSKRALAIYKFTQIEDDESAFFETERLLMENINDGDKISQFLLGYFYEGLFTDLSEELIRDIRKEAENDEILAQQISQYEQIFYND